MLLNGSVSIRAVPFDPREVDHRNRRSLAVGTSTPERSTVRAMTVIEAPSAACTIRHVVSVSTFVCTNHSPVVGEKAGLTSTLPHRALRVLHPDGAGTVMLDVARDHADARPVRPGRRRGGVERRQRRDGTRGVEGAHVEGLRRGGRRAGSVDGLDDHREGDRIAGCSPGCVGDRAAVVDVQLRRTVVIGIGVPHGLEARDDGETAGDHNERQECADGARPTHPIHRRPGPRPLEFFESFESFEG